MRPSPWGWVILLFYIATFLFYAYCRIGHTLDRHNSAFAYQVCPCLTLITAVQFRQLDDLE